jgi:enoyl-CoA hydratase/carnithine racemase
VLTKREGARLELVLNRPARRNALSVEMRDALGEALRLATSDATIAEIVLRGNGPAFSAGGDLDEFGTFPDPTTAHAVRAIRNPARALAACADRVRVELHGACVGAGIELAAFAWRVVAGPDAFFQLPEVAMGLVPGAGGTVSIPRRIGRQRTAYLCLSAVRLDAETALSWGLVDEIH